jgi:CelD/BcsL family acetyltransferase involved in cellulose biosynthesis
MPPAPIRVETVTSLDRIAALDGQWSALLASAMPGRGFFLTLPRLRAMADVHASARHPGGHRSPYLLLAWRGEQLVGAFPLVREQKPITRAGVRRLLLWGGDGSALGAETEVPLLGTAEEAAGVARAFRSALLDAPNGEFDVLELANLREDAASLPALKLAFADGRWTPESFESFHTDLSGSFEAYRATRNGGRIRELGRLRRRLEAQHALSIVEVAHLSDAQRDDVMALHAARQHTLRGKGWRRESVFEPPAYREALATVLAESAHSGEARHRLLYADDTLISFLLGFEHQGTFIAWLTAVHAEYLAFGPGGVLFWEAMQREFARGAVRRVEFGFGRTFVKETMSTHALRPQHLTWVRPNAPLSRLRLGGYQVLSDVRDRLARKKERVAAE